MNKHLVFYYSGEGQQHFSASEKWSVFWIPFSCLETALYTDRNLYAQRGRHSFISFSGPFNWKQHFTLPRIPPPPHFCPHYFHISLSLTFNYTPTKVSCWKSLAAKNRDLLFDKSSQREINLSLSHFSHWSFNLWADAMRCRASYLRTLQQDDVLLSWTPEKPHLEWT